MAKKKYNVIREEMLQVASNVAQEKNIDQDSVFSAMEQALEKAARVKYGQEIDIIISTYRVRKSCCTKRKRCYYSKSKRSRQI